VLSLLLPDTRHGAEPVAAEEPSVPTVVAAG